MPGSGEHARAVSDPGYSPRVYRHLEDIEGVLDAVRVPAVPHSAVVSR